MTEKMLDPKIPKMKNSIHFVENAFRTFILIGVLLMSSCKPEIEKATPNFIIINSQLLKDIEHSNKPLIKESIKDFLSVADTLLDMKLLSVMDKKMIPPSGDKHDYMSTSAYRWPDTTKADGLPWIRRDGEFNKKAHQKSDHYTFGDVHRAIAKLSLAYHLTQEDKYARKALEMTRHWYLNPATRMNPHFKYAQAIPGENEGSFWGMISGSLMIWTIDCMELIKPSGLVSESDMSGLRDWFSEYYEWATTSKFGKQEDTISNNHSVFYDMHVAGIATFLGKHEEARKIYSNVGKRRIDKQIRQDGSLPEELNRTRSYHYSIFALQAYIMLAKNAEKYQINLWHYPSEDDARIRKAIEFLIPAGLGTEEWQYPDIRFERKELLHILANARYAYPDMEDIYARMEDSFDEVSVFVYLLKF